MTDHEAIEELLAGYALRSLSGPDAAEADRLLTRHVPGCPSCRATLEAFGAVASDLALDAPAAAPPETLLPRLRRQLEPRGRRRLPWAAAVAAGLVLILAGGGVLVSRDGDGASVQRLADIQQALDFALRDDAHTVQMGPVTEVAAPGVETFFLYGTAVPQPPPGMVYRLWAVSGAGADHLGDFLPSPEGLVVIQIDVDATTYDHVAVTVEPTGSEPSIPGEPAWPEAA